MSERFLNRFRERHRAGFRARQQRVTSTGQVSIGRSDMPLPADHAARRRDQRLAQARRLTLWVAGGAAAPSLGLGTAFAHALPRHPAPTPAPPPAGTPPAGPPPAG